MSESKTSYETLDLMDFEDKREPIHFRKAKGSFYSDYADIVQDERAMKFLILAQTGDLKCIEFAEVTEAEYELAQEVFCNSERVGIACVRAFKENEKAILHRFTYQNQACSLLTPMTFRRIRILTKENQLQVS